ncbi:hypothetical protein LIER_41527 [Lithospermum erythrorhizon]|uniref:Uncharacterized protein n=1 Tax=Lithospermum erythrorhizon TaxID=34254 RepID=A0AAV3RED3_LITER
MLLGRGSFHRLYCSTTLEYEETLELFVGLKKLEEGFPKILALDVFCDLDVLIKAGLSRGHDSFPDVDLATLLRLKDGKVVVPHQVRYLDVISENRLLSEMLAPGVPSPSLLSPRETIEVAYALSLRLNSQHDEEVARLKGTLVSVENERDDALSKRDELAALCERQCSDHERLLADAREASKLYKSEGERL